MNKHLKTTGIVDEASTPEGKRYEQYKKDAKAFASKIDKEIEKFAKKVGKKPAAEGGTLQMYSKYIPKDSQSGRYDL